MFQFELMALVGAIVLLIILLQLRHVLARRFPALKARIVSVTPPKSVADLYEKAHEQLTALGFEGPTWILRESEPLESGYPPLCVVYRHHSEGDLAWLMPPVSPAMPNRLLGYWTTKLQDGTLVSSQSFDPYLECIEIPEAPAQTIDGLSIAEQWKQHKDFRGKFRIDTAMDSISNEAIVHQAGEAHNAHREKLLEKGALWKDTNGVYRPRLKFAVRMFWKVLRRPKPREEIEPVPASRLVILANTLEGMRHSEPSKRTQIGLFSGSVILSVIIGAVVWDLSFAIILLAVVIFHELGHYLAMRAFGYRNVHMLALPLVGGVTIGHDANPDAAKKAWMSLMGPLPGIIVGWILVACMFSLNLEGSAAELLRTTAIVILFINYLNILPILPLDGGHVVQSLLPPRWLNMQAAIIIVLCLAGIVVSLYVKFYLLAFLAATQLFLVRSYSQTAAAVRRLQNEGIPPSEQKRPVRLLRVFELLEDIFGPAKNAQLRINQAEHVLQVLDTKSMSVSQRSVLSTVYFVLLIVPVMVIILSTMISWDTMLSENDIAARMEEERQERTKYIEQTHSKSLQSLLHEVSKQGYNKKLLPPASESAIRQTESRLGIKLPQDLKAVYRIANGVPAIGLASLEDINYANKIADLHLDDFVYEGKLWLTSGLYEDTQQHEIQLGNTSGWIYLGGMESGESLLFLDVAEPPAIQGFPFIDFYYESPQAYPSLRAWLEASWVSHRLSEQQQRKFETQKRANYKSLAATDIDSLIDQFERPSLLIRILSQWPDWPQGATDIDISSAETRLNVTFPSDIRELFLQHNGFPPLNILSLDKIQSVNRLPKNQLLNANNDWQLIDSQGEEKTAAIQLQDLINCVILGGSPVPESAGMELSVYPSLLWCPELPQYNNAMVLLYQHKLFNTFTDYVRDSVAARNTY